MQTAYVFLKRNFSFNVACYVYCLFKFTQTNCSP